MTIIYVASDKPGSGKTALSTSLSVLFAKQGLSSAVFKLTESAEEKEIFTQHQLQFSSLLTSKNILDSIELPEDFSVQGLINQLNEQTKDFNVLIVEAPNYQALDDIAKIARNLNASILKIVNYSPSLNLETFQVWSSAFDGIKSHFLINNATKYSNHSIETNLLAPSESLSNQILGVIPENRTLLGLTIDTILNLINGEIIDFNNAPDQSHLIKHFMVGGWSLDPGELYFGLLNNKAAIIKGDRPDMQMAALSTNTSCLILTGGMQPNNYVHLQAEDKGIPIILTNHDTVSTMEMLNDSQNYSAFDHPEKLDKFVDLLEQNIDTKSILKLI
jgi:BioD-like phosphotransacetylase family protein